MIDFAEIYRLFYNFQQIFHFSINLDSVEDYENYPQTPPHSPNISIMLNTHY